MIDVTFSNGKYRLVYDRDECKVYRNGERWPVRERELIGDNMVLALAADLEEAREQLARMRAATEREVTFLSAHGEALYVGDRLAHYQYGGQITDRHALRLLGYDVRQIEARWEDVGWVPGSEPSRRPCVPNSLTDLKAKLAAVEARKRRERIESLRQELADLEGEEGKDGRG